MIDLGDMDTSEFITSLTGLNDPAEIKTQLTNAFAKSGLEDVINENWTSILESINSYKITISADTNKVSFSEAVTELSTL